MRCPSCDTDADPALQVGAVAICSVCGTSTIEDGAIIRKLTGAEAQALSETDLGQLRRARTTVKARRRT